MTEHSQTEARATAGLRRASSPPDQYHPIDEAVVDLLYVAARLHVAFSRTYPDASRSDVYGPFVQAAEAAYARALGE